MASHHSEESAQEITLIADFIDREFADDGNAPDPPSRTLRRYAERLREIANHLRDATPASNVWAEVAWVAEDLTDRFHCLPVEAEEFLEENEDDLQLAMIETGWAVIRNICEFERRNE